MVSYLKSMYGDAATAENDFGYDWHPRIIGDHSHMPMMVDMADGKVKGMFAMGQNPASAVRTRGLQRTALAKLDWLVVKRQLRDRDGRLLVRRAGGHERRRSRTADIKTEVFFFPSAQVAEKEGSFTNTQRLLQWHEKAADPPGDARSDLWFTYQLGKRLKTLYAGSTAAARPGLPEPDLGLRARPGRDAELADQGRAERAEDPAGDQRLQVRPAGRAPGGFADLKDDGSTTCASWIYSGVYPDPDREPRRPAASPTPEDSARPTWAGASPGRPTGASSTTAPRPGRTASRGASARSGSGGTRTASPA